MTGSATFSGRTAVKGSVHLILGEGTTLTAAQGITVSPGNSLRIDGTGTLNAVGIEGFAAIGGAVGESCGAVTIDGGTVSATGGVWGAGIGGGRNGNGGTITINGGNVAAQCYDPDNARIGFAAGIGGGDTGSGGTIAINGGTVYARGNRGSAGIGGGGYGSGGTITITDGNVTAIGSRYEGARGGAGIGAGRAPNDAASGDSGSITITGGTVVAIGGENAQAIGVSNEVADHDSGTLAFGDVNVRADQNQDSFADYASRDKMCRGAQVYIEPCGHSYDTDPALILQWCHWCGAVGPVGGKGGFVLPASVKSIAPGAFAGLSMRTVYIPDGCTAIGAGAFADCRNLKQIRIPDTVKPEDVRENVFPADAALFLIGLAEGTASQLANDPAHPEWKFVEE